MSRPVLPWSVIIERIIINVWCPAELINFFISQHAGPHSVTTEHGGCVRHRPIVLVPGIWSCWLWVVTANRIPVEQEICQCVDDESQADQDVLYKLAVLCSGHDTNLYMMRT